VAADQIAFVLGLAIGGAILVGFGFVDLWLRTVHGNDFSGFWAGPRAFLDGVDPYDPGRFPDVVARYGTQDTEPVYGYPPWDLLVVLPFAALPLEVASMAWLVIGLGLAVIGLGTLLAERAPGLPSVHFLVGLSLLASQPALITFYSGQWGFLLTGTLALTVRWLGVGSSRRAGVAALAMVTKPQLFVFAAWALIHTALARRQAAFIAVAAGGASALVAFSWLLFPGWLGAFLTHIAPMRTSYPPRSVTIATPLGEMLGPTGLWLVLPIMAVVLVVALRFDAKSDASLAVWLVASVVLASYAWSYDHLVLLVPIVLAVGALRFDRTRATVVGVLSCVALIVEALFLYQLSAARGSQSLNALVPLSVFAVVVGGLWPFRMAGRPETSTR